MEIVKTYYVIAETGKELIRNGKSIGTAVWLRIGEPYDDIENVSKAIPNDILRATEPGKVLHKVGTDIYTPSIWLEKGESQDSWEEVEEPQPEIEESEEAVVEVAEEAEDIVEQENEDDSIESNTEN